MVEITREEYLQALTLVATRGIENPTEEDLVKVTPHLTDTQRSDAFTPKNEESGPAYVAVPPVLIRRGYNVVSYRPEPLTLSDGRIAPPSLDYAFASRTPESYADRKKHGDVFYNMPHQEEAMKFAKKHWGSRLVTDNWNYFTTMYVQDPTDLYPKEAGWGSAETPKTKFVIYYTSYRDGSDMANDHSKPQSEIVNENVAIATLNPVEGSEIKGGRGGWTEFQCAHCAGGLDLTECTNCGNKFRDDYMRSGHITPISPKLVQLLEEAGHTFKMSPTIAWEREKKSWEEVVKRYDLRDRK